MNQSICMQSSILQQTAESNIWFTLTIPSYAWLMLKNGVRRSFVLRSLWNYWDSVCVQRKRKRLWIVSSLLEKACLPAEKVFLWRKSISWQTNMQLNESNTHIPVFDHCHLFFWREIGALVWRLSYYLLPLSVMTHQFWSSACWYSVSSGIITKSPLTRIWFWTSEWFWAQNLTCRSH